MYTVEELKSKYSKQLVNFIANWEGFQARIKPCLGGFPTIGYGHKVRTSYKETDFKKNYKRFGISKSDAMALLLRDIAEVDKYLSRYLKNTSLQIHQKEALISLVYNWGVGNFSRSKLRNALAAGEYDNAANEFLDIINVNGVPCDGLKNRREQEVLVFKYGWDKLNDSK